MKFLLTIFICLFYLPIVFGQQNTPATINWMTWDEAVAQSKIDEKPKKVFIDFYTAWCGWCKRMMRRPLPIQR
jgi:thiol:disulfide interchange protein